MPRHKFDDRMVEIQKAVAGDAETICQIRDSAWVDAYPNPELGITAVDVKLMAQGRDGEFVPRRIAYLKEKLAQENHSDGATFVANVDGKTVGFVDPSIEDGRRRIGAIYVLPDAQGMGIGTKLMRQALDWHGRQEDIYLEVVSYNQNAIDFYKRFGFEQTDTIVPEEEGRPDYLKSLPQIEMVLKAEGAHPN